MNYSKLIYLKSLLESKNPLWVLIESKILDENFAEWAENEIKLAGLYDEDSDYKGMLGYALKELVDVFSNQGHSGFSASLISEIFHKLVQWEPLTDCDHSDYNDVSEMSGKKPMFQCKRCSYMFSTDEGVTWFDIRKVSKI